MNKKKLALLLVFIMVALMGCGKKDEEVLAESPASETEATVSETATETTPGLEDSIFDTEPEGTDQEVTEPEETDGEQPDNQDDSVTPPEDDPATTPPATDPTKQPGSTDDETTDDSAAGQLSDYEKFQDMSPAEQQEYMESFEDIDAFFEWYNKAKEEHEAANPPIDAGDGNVDMGDIIGGSS